MTLISAIQYYPLLLWRLAIVAIGSEYGCSTESHKSMKISRDMEVTVDEIDVSKIE